MAMEFSFGVLPSEDHASSGSWDLQLLPKGRDEIQRWQAQGADRYWVYPAPWNTFRRELSSSGTENPWRLVPGSQRPAAVWSVPATHRLILKKNLGLSYDETKRGVGTFLIHVIGCVHGVEVQHEDWQVVGRQHKRTGGLFGVARSTLAQLLDRATDWYLAQQASVRMAMTSALYIHNRVHAYEWAWERHAWQFAVFDACWCVVKETKAVRALSGGRRLRSTERLECFAKAFGMRIDSDKFTKWVDSRNNLVHQLTWGASVPGHDPEPALAKSYLDLRGFATMALLAAIDYRSPSLAGPWDCGGRLLLEPMP